MKKVYAIEDKLNKMKVKVYMKQAWHGIWYNQKIAPCIRNSQDYLTFSVLYDVIKNIIFLKENLTKA